MTDLISGQVGGEDLRQFHWQLRRGLLMHRKGRLSLFYKLQFPYHDLSGTSADEVASHLDLVAWFGDEPPAEIAQHPHYFSFIHALKSVLLMSNAAQERALAGQLDTDHFGALVEALKEFDRCADVLDSVVTNSLTDIDPLTGLLNRAALERDVRRELAKALRSGAPLSVAMIDADRFKVVNDTFGHAFGDFVLRTLAERFMESLRPSDLLYRYGGEEFLVLLPNTPIEKAFSVLERLRKRACSAPIVQGDASTMQAVSVGISLLEPNMPESNGIERADQALYSAKSQGRNRTVISPAISVDEGPAADGAVGSL